MMNPDRWAHTQAYSQEVFGREDEHLASLMDRAGAAGLPRIAVSADVGRLLKILVSLTDGMRALELGTLAGYSAIWIARGLAPEGTLTTIEYDARHAAFARTELEAAGVADRVDVVEGPALRVLPGLRESWGDGTVDFAFIDAVKSEYVAYLDMVGPMIKPGGLIVADNVYGTGAGWIDEGHGTDAFNRKIASDPAFEAVAVPLREGVLIARRS
ncbi:MAG: O-methyltransferase [Actinobacteria bacterium]|nr:MAG: O-methyltransferase [Actinomycetota bacterium]